MQSLGGYPPWAVLQDMIDSADSDRNGKASKLYSIKILYGPLYY